MLKMKQMMLSKFLISAVTAFALCGMASQVSAQEERVGVVNTDRILSESNAAKASQAKIEQEFSARQKTLNDQGAKLKAMIDKYEKDRPTLSATQRTSREADLQTADRDFSRQRDDFQRDLNARRNQELQALLDKANQAVRQVATSEKFDLILTEAAFVNPKLDITDKVLKLLNGGK